MTADAFQLPLSGSLDVFAERVHVNVKELSTPSLGITQASIADRENEVLLSTPSLGITSPVSIEDYFRWAIRLSTPSLGITAGKS